MVRRVTIEDVVDIDYGWIEGYLRRFIESELRESSRGGYVIGLSGGLDSSTTLALAVRSIGREKVLALVMPDPEVTPEADVEDAVSLARALNVRYNVINIAPIVDAYKGAIPVYESEEKDKVPLGNLRARIRMTLLYYYANKLDYLVLGTGDRSEILIGYYTKYGDGGVDIAPLAVLYKSQVRKLALHLGLPERIALKPSSPRLWRGHEAEKELGVSYEQVDLVLHSKLDLGYAEEEIPEATGVPEAVVRRVLEMYRRSEHKRVGVKTPEVKPVVDLLVRRKKA
ncbi:MAG: NAD+ synthase [Desulfurococcales archaeon]|jgi:NAD+ synthase|nr:NAD+ synthase [Desulfurococcaceae archaeon]MCC6060128.1 NAD+ synthase [Desulfurococcaceae archaeon]MDT7865653.1 NAD+ synthase [Desulfurococcales archaeon]